MRIGIFSEIFQQLPCEQALDKVLSYRATAVEIGTSGLTSAYPCPLDDLLSSGLIPRTYLKNDCR